MEREVGGGIGMGNTCKPMAVSFQCMTKFTTKKKGGGFTSAINSVPPSGITGSAAPPGMPVDLLWAGSTFLVNLVSSSLGQK